MNKKFTGLCQCCCADILLSVYLKSSDAKASKCHLKFSSLMMIFILILLQK